MKRTLVAVGALLSLLSLPVLADQCTNVFTDSVSTFSTSGSLRIDRLAQIRGTDGVIDFPFGSIDDKTQNSSCVTTSCQASGAPASDLDLPTFKTTTSNQDIQISRFSFGSLPAGHYDRVNLKEGSSIEFTTVNGEYRMSRLIVERNSIVNMSPGEYWIEDVDFKEGSRLNVVGDGTVRIYARDDVKFERNTLINAGRDPADLVIISYDDIEFKEGSAGYGFFYAADDFKLERISNIVGGVSAKDIELKENSTITYSEASLTTIEFGEECESGSASPEAVAHYALEEAAWNGNGSILDSTGNNYHASPVGTVSPYLSSAQISCQAVNVPFNSRNSEYDAVDSRIDVASDIGTSGTIAFWYRPNLPWQGVNYSRQLFDASSSQSNQYFYAALNDAGRIEFGVEDDSDADRRILTQSYNFAANEWVHLAFTYDFGSGDLRVFVNAVEASSNYTATASLNGSVGNFESLYIGDNRSSYIVSHGSGYSADGQIDEIYVYKGALDAQAITTLKDNTTTCQAPAPEPIAYWALDICSVNGTVGEVIDSINGYNGQAYPGTTMVDDGRFCQAAEFFGQLEHINIPHQNAFEVSDGAISFWFKRDSATSGLLGLVSKESLDFDAGGHLGIWSNSSKTVWVRHQYIDSFYGYNAYLESGPVADDQWHHVVYTWGSAGATLYVDGQMVDQRTDVVAGIQYNYEPIILGADATVTGDQMSPVHQLSRFFDGKIDEIQFFNQQLNSGHVSELFNKSGYTCISCVRDPVLESHWPLDICSVDGSGGEIIDVGDSGLNNHGRTLGNPEINPDAKFCQAVKFLGGDDHINIPHNGNYATTDGGISFWFKRASGTNGDMGLFSKDSSGHDQGGHLTMWSKSNRIVEVRHQYFENGAERTQYLRSSSLDNDVWHHVMYTWGSDGMRLYVNNQLVAQHAVSTGLENNPEPIILGASAIYTGDQVSSPNQLEQFFVGELDDIRFYSTYQPQASVVDELYNQSPYSCSETCDTTPVLESLWTMDVCALDGTGGEIIDTGDSNLNNHGRSVGPVSVNYDARYCQGASFSGDGGHINIPHNGNYLVRKGGISFWYNRNVGTSGEQGLFSKDSGGHDAGGHVTIWSRGNRSVYVRHQIRENNTDRTVYLTSPAMNDGEWHHVFYTWGSDGMTLYVDNQLVDQASGETAGVENNPEPIILGASAIYSGDSVSEPQTLSDFFNGDMDDVRFYSTWQPKAAFVSEVYNQSPYTCTQCNLQPVAYYQFEEANWPSVNSIIDTMSHFNGSPLGSVSPVFPNPEKSCRAMNVPDNSVNSSQTDALDTGINIRDDVGTKGTISFWYKSNTAWDTHSGSSEGGRTLFDATTTDSARFFMRLRRNGSIRFSMNDNFGRSYDIFSSSGLSIPADQWAFIAVTWDLNAGRLKLYIRSNSENREYTQQNGFVSSSVANLSHLIIGDSYANNNVSNSSADGQFDNVRIYNYVQSETQIEADKDDVTDCPLEVHHYDLSYSNPGSVCSLSTLTVRACADESCSLLADVGSSVDIRYTDSVGSESIIVSSLALTNGTASYDWGLFEPKTVTLSLANTMPMAFNPLTCSTENCELTFDDLSLKLLVDGNDSAIPNQLSVTPFEGTFGVVADNVCNNYPTDIPVEIAIECNSPATCSTTAGNEFYLDGVVVPKVNAGEALSYVSTGDNFDSTNGITLGSLQYNDAGQITIHIKVGTATVSKTVVVYPETLRLATDAVAIAGTNTNLQITALSNGVVLPNYQPGQLHIAMERTLPNTLPSGISFTGNLTSDYFTTVRDGVGVSDGSGAAKRRLTSFDPLTSPLDFEDGIGALPVAYSEAGNTLFDVADINYFGQLLTSSVISPSDREVKFIPAYFRVENVDHSYGAFCGNIHYLGQNFSSPPGTEIDLQAYNNGGVPTQYYDSGIGGGVFAFASVGLLSNRTYIESINSRTLSINAAGSVTLSGAADFDAAFRMTISGADTFNVPKQGAVSAPLIAGADYDIALRIPSGDLTDANGVGLEGAPAQFEFGPLTSGVELREGRFVLANAFGPENQDLSVPFGVQYFDGNDWVVNTQDSCTTFDAINLVSKDSSSAITTFGDGILDAGVTSNTAGMMQIDAFGSIREIPIEYQIPADLLFLQFNWNGSGPENPSAVASFGQFRGNDRIIHWREVFR
ncbi:LamG domain-containing protein [Alteromonas sp. a30]|uniref:LamG domain-containing protein n=1 Tax=Alteromonas sp. a30 TaxID=2730917 RepID=UPI0022829710|nr:LamG domain-containing protein [Alteromonas sp. a30]MCY7295263.1 LamG domain-containing protein [Alteromonas sp. a30]